MNDDRGSVTIQYRITVRKKMIENGRGRVCDTVSSRDVVFGCRVLWRVVLRYSLTLAVLTRALNQLIHRH